MVVMLVVMMMTVFIAPFTFYFVESRNVMQMDALAPIFFGGEILGQVQLNKYRRKTRWEKNEGVCRREREKSLELSSNYTFFMTWNVTASAEKKYELVDNNFPRKKVGYTLLRSWFYYKTKYIFLSESGCGEDKRKVRHNFSLVWKKEKMNA